MNMDFIFAYLATVVVGAMSGTCFIMNLRRGYIVSAAMLFFLAFIAGGDLVNHYPEFVAALVVWRG